jgi:hypothetical protein
MKELLETSKQSTLDALKMVESWLAKSAGNRVFKDGKDITYRCKITESDSAVTVDIGCDLDEALMRISDPTSMQQYYMLSRNRVTGQPDTIAIQLPKFIAEIMSRVLPGSFINNSTQA